MNKRTVSIFSLSRTSFYSVFSIGLPLFLRGRGRAFSIFRHFILSSVTGNGDTASIMNKRTVSIFSLSRTSFYSVFSIPLFLRGRGRAFSIVRHFILSSVTGNGDTGMAGMYSGVVRGRWRWIVDPVYATIRKRCSNIYKRYIL